MEKEKKKVLYRFGLPIILGTILLLGVSYAWLSLTLTGTKTNVLKAGTLSLVLDDTEGNGIDISGGVPMLDEVGETQSPYTFTLTNNGTVESEYTIYLDDVALESNETRLPDSVIKYNLVKDVSSSTALLSSIGSNPNRVLDSGVIGPEESHSYELRLWLDENMTNADMGKVFRGKIRVVAEQVIEELQLPTDESCFVVNESDTTVSITQYICGPTVYDQWDNEQSANTNPINDIVDVIIPATINGKQVTNIDTYAFQMTSITSVVIPEGVTMIGRSAFAYNQLTNVVLPKGINVIELYAFADNQLTSVILPEDTVSIFGSVFAGNKLVTLVIPESVKMIDPGAFSNNQLTSVTIKGKSSTADFDSYPTSSPFGWASGYSDANITWEP